MMSRENLYGKRDHFRKEYEARVVWLAYELDVSKSDCFLCQNKSITVSNLFGSVGN